MTPTDCVDVVEFLAARCPAMRMHDNTPEAWYLDLAGHTRDDALEAVRRCSLNSTFVGIGDLIGECTRIRDKRIGVEKVAARQAQIERENAGELQARHVAALGAGRPLPPETLEDRAARRAMLAKAAHTKREATVAEVAARAVDAERRATALAELANHPGREGSVEALTTAAPDGWSQQNPDSEEETA